MKTILFLLISISSLLAQAQIANKKYNEEKSTKRFLNESEIVANDKNVTMIVKVIYNAIPDGYHITFTKSFIGKTIPVVELEMNKVIDDLILKAKELSIDKKDIITDIISLDPVFDFNRNDSGLNHPVAYKVTENITFNIKNISYIRRLAKLCLDYGIYDLINAEAYLLDSKKIEDTLSNKAVEILNMKKKLCSEIGWPLTGGSSTFIKYKDVIYPSERYLSSYLNNAGLYKHEVSQNATIQMNRRLDVDNYYNLNLKDADFVFNQQETNPVIQFFYQINYTFTRKDTEAELREKIRKEEETKHEKQFYILDKNGNLKKMDLSE